MAINPNTTFTAGAILTAAQQNRFPRGIMGGVSRTAGNTTITTSVADITGMTVTFTAEASRVYKASWLIAGVKDTSTGFLAAFLTNSANTVQASVYNTAVIVVGSGYANLSGVAFLTTLTAGSQTLKLRCQAENNAGTILASGTNPCVLIIEDCGPA